MKNPPIKDLTPEERAAKVREHRQALFTLRVQKATGQLENPMKLRQLRRDIARLETLAAADAKAARAARKPAKADAK